MIPRATDPPVKSPFVGLHDLMRNGCLRTVTSCGTNGQTTGKLSPNQTPRLLMRTLIQTTAFLLLATSAFANKDRFELPETLAVSFKTGERATFVVSNSVVTAITLRIGSADYAVPASECAKLRDIRFESVSLLWKGAYKSAAEADYFYLRFEMGAESARTFGELPRVQLMFRDRKFDGMKVTKKTAQNVWRDSKL